MALVGFLMKKLRGTSSLTLEVIVISFPFSILVSTLSTSSSFFTTGVSSSPFAAFLNSLIPPPSPFINSGIFLPPKKSNTTTNTKIISGAPNLPMILFFNFYKVT